MSVPTRPHLRRTFGIAAAALVLPFTLSACGDALENAAENAAEEAIKDGSSGDVDVDIDGGEVKIENSDGSYVSGGDLPDGFPEDDVPLIGDVKFGSRTNDGDTQGWTVSTQVDSSAADAFDEASAKLEDAGFESQGQSTGTYAGFRSDKYQVVLTSADDQSGGAIMSYIVGAAE
ncbi:MAG: hypothetical protein NTX33_12860 [Propionibacteriales bacterium]|nr:hypothetical protein [Propionibacteriales bacterium]